MQARLPYVVYGSADPKAGACHTLFEITSDPRLNHRAHVISGVMADECADLAIGMMLASARQIVLADHHVRSGEWLKGPIRLGHSVGGKTVGVVGLGGIGRAIADRAQAFRMSVLWHGPRRKPDAIIHRQECINAFEQVKDAPNCHAQ